MTDTDLNLEDLTANRDGDETTARFLKLADDMLREGWRPDCVFNSILQAAISASLNHSLAAHRDFLIHANSEVPAWLTVVEDYCDKLFEAADDTSAVCS